MRDCHNLQVMLYSQTEVSVFHNHDCVTCFQPVVESCTNIKFLPMTYAYKELFSQMRPCMVSPWTNNWNDIFDFTPHKKSPDASVPNFYCVSSLETDFIKPLEQVKELIMKATVAKGVAIKSLNELEPADLDQIDIDIAIEKPSFSLGDYFDNFSVNMLRTVPPTRQF